MLRIQRSIAASYSHTQVQSTLDAAKLAAQIKEDDAAGRQGAGGRMAAYDAMAAAEQEALQAAADAAPARALPGFVSAGVIQQGQQDKAEKATLAAHNPEEIDIDTGDAEGGDGPDDVVEVDKAELQTKAVPAAVFGSLAAKAAADDKEAADGALLDRIKKRRHE